MTVAASRGRLLPLTISATIVTMATTEEVTAIEAIGMFLHRRLIITTMIDMDVTSAIVIVGTMKGMTIATTTTVATAAGKGARVVVTSTLGEMMTTAGTMIIGEMMIEVESAAGAPAVIDLESARANGDLAVAVLRRVHHAGGSKC